MTVIRCAPYPGEYFEGHFGRLAAINGEDWFEATLQENTEALPYRKDIAALIAGMNSLDYTFKHSLNNVRSPVVGANLSRHLGRRRNFRWESSLVFDITDSRRRYAYFCSACAHEDQSDKCLPFWRNMHQIPGLLSCKVHGLLLKRVTTEAFASPPGDPSHGPISECQWPDQGSAFIERFSNIVFYFLEQCDYTNTRCLYRKINDRLNELNLNDTQFNKPVTLSDYLLSEAPNQWLLDEFPDHLPVENILDFCWLDRSCRKSDHQGFPTLTCAIIFAALYSNSKEAISHISLELSNEVISQKLCNLEWRVKSHNNRNNSYESLFSKPMDRTKRNVTLGAIRRFVINGSTAELDSLKPAEKSSLRSNYTSCVRRWVIDTTA